jgi:biopolymer transport protein ExbD
MRAPVYQPVRRYGFNMTPMIDVVFLLVIFFLVSSHLARNESQIKLELPVASTGSDDRPREIPRITVNVKPDGSLWVSGRAIAAEQLEPLLRTATSREGGDVEVRIRGSRQAPYANIEPILLACTKSGIWNVTYAVYKEDPK